jgi:hypothetical protein
MVVEWNKSMSMEATLAKLITVGVMTKAAIGGWRTSADESYLDPHPGEIVLFEDFFWRGFGNPCHPFLRKLCDYYRVSICNLHPTLFLLCPFLLPSTSRISASSPTSICGGTLSASRSKEVQEDPR